MFSSDSLSSDQGLHPPFPHPLEKNYTYVRYIYINECIQLHNCRKQVENAPAVTTNSGMSKANYKSKMADASSDILFDSVRFILSNWTVLQLAVEHGFGGKDADEKAEWMVNVINQVLKENGQYSYILGNSKCSRVLVPAGRAVKVTYLNTYPYVSIITIIFNKIIVRVVVYTLFMIVITVNV